MSPARLCALLALLVACAAASRAGDIGEGPYTSWSTGDADRPRGGWEEDTGATSTSSRSLRAAAATCPEAIPACQRCDTINKRSTCRTCKQGYDPTRGNKNCVCPPGKYELCDAAGQCSCQSCGRGFFCPGGDADAGNGASADRGRRLSCFSSAASSSDTSDSVAALGLTTRSTKATKHSECVTMPGWFMTALSPSTQAAAKCAGPTYSPGGDRRTVCRSCQDGSEVDSTLPAGALQTSSSICRVPAGKFVQGNQITACPPGTFRAGQARASSPTARTCTACASGWTTAAQESKSRADCNLGTAGYELGGVQPGQAASLCDFGTYYDGSAVAVAGGQATCRPCPDGTVTQRRGAESDAECGIPPGYYLKAGEGLARCPSSLTRADGAQEGFYRAGWVDASQRDAATESGDGSSVCSPCGSGILSDLVEDDENPLATSGSKVATSSDACYVTAGMGLVPDPDRGGSLPKAVLCPSNTYGAAGAPGSKVYGLTGSPCAPCPRGTASPPMSTSQDNCTVPPGYGFTDGAITQCADGYYSAGGVHVGACARCPSGRTTVPGSVSPSTEQASVNNCYVSAGFGLSFKGLPPGTNPFVPPAGLSVPATTVLSSSTAAVVQCPVGYYGDGGSTSNVNTLCRACPEGATTEQVRSISAANCSLCLAGFGNTASSGGLQCAACALGTFSSVASAEACTNCPTTTFGFTSPFGDAEDFVSDGTTLKQGASSQALCVVRANQPDQDVGQSFALDGAPSGWSSVLAVASASACVASCARDSCCFAALEHTSPTEGSCRTLTLRALLPYDAPTGGLQLLVKLLPSDFMGSSSIGSQSVASGSYTQCDANAWAATGVDSLGAPLDGANAGWLATSRGGCQVLCDSLSECWGFFYNRTAGACLLRTGSPSPATRSFFVAPSAPPCSGNAFYAGPSVGCAGCPAGTALNAARTECSINVCSPGCGANGNCTAPNTCTCAAGYSGAQCSVPVCSPGCGANGNCTAPNTCTCAAGYSGAQCDVSPLGPSCAQAIAASTNHHTVALLQDGTVKSWGYNFFGQLGDGSNTNQPAPVSVQGLTNVRAIAANKDHSLALLKDGTVRAWGWNGYALLGDGTNVHSSTPVVVLDLTSVSAIAAAIGHNVALLQNGTVRCWGKNEQGQLGDNTTTPRGKFVAVTGLPARATAVAAGTDFSLALLEDGTVVGWGLNAYGQLGDNTTTDRWAPVAVKNLSDVTAIAAGTSHAVALVRDGTIRTFGRNNAGQLGDGTTTDRWAPVAVTGLTGVRAIAAGASHTLALLQDGTVRTFGLNNLGQLADGTTINRATPVTAQGLTRVRGIAAGYVHSAAVLDDGTIRSWGRHNVGQRGDNTTMADSNFVTTPVVTVGFESCGQAGV